MIATAQAETVRRTGCRVCNHPLMKLATIRSGRDGLMRTASAFRLEAICVSRMGVPRPRHEMVGSDARCIFCDWLLPNGFALCPCGSGKLLEVRGYRDAKSQRRNYLGRMARRAMAGGRKDGANGGKTK